MKSQKFLTLEEAIAAAPHSLKKSPRLVAKLKSLANHLVNENSDGTTYEVNEDGDVSVNSFLYTTGQSIYISGTITMPRSWRKAQKANFRFYAHLSQYGGGRPPKSKQLNKPHAMIWLGVLKPSI